MTDETGPDRASTGPRQQQDALESWFRPRSTPQSKPEHGSEPAEGAESADSAAATESTERVNAGEDEQPEPKARADEAADDAADEERDEEGDEADAGAQRPDEALTQVLRAPSTVDPEATQLAMPRTDDASSAPASAPASPPAKDGDGDEPDRAKKAGRDEREPVIGADDRTQVIPVASTSNPPRPYAAAAPTQAIPRTTTPSQAPQSSMAVRGGTARPAQNVGAGTDWRPQTASANQPPTRQSGQTKGYPAPAPGQAPILPVRGYDDYDDFDDYEYGDGSKGGRSARPRRRRGLLVSGGIAVVIVAVIAALTFTGKINIPGLSAKPVPTVGFSPSGSDAGSDATQTGTAFLNAWQNGNLKSAANITDNPDTALAELTAYKNDLKISSLSLMPGTASAAGWMTFGVSAQVGAPASAWSYNSGMATYSKNVDGYTRWFVKWQSNVLFTALKPGQKLALGPIPPTAGKVVDSNGQQITPANAPSLNGIVSALEKAAPTTDGTPGQKVEIENADGSVASTVAKVSDPVNTSAVKTTIDLRVQTAAQNAVNQAPHSSMVVIQPSTGNILAVANNPPGGLDVAMVGRYAPGSTFKTITTTMVLNKGVITDLNQTWDCPKFLHVDGITLQNSEQEEGLGKSFLWDFADSCNNAFSRFGSSSGVSKATLAQTAHDYYGFNQKWDVGLGQPTTYGNVPATSSNSLAEELVGQDQITTSPLVMASVAATIANGSFKQPIMVPGAAQLPLTPLPAATDDKLKTLMRAVVANGTLAGVLHQPGVYGKTGTAEVQGKPANSWTIAVHGDFAVAALAVGGNFGAQTAGPECDSLLRAVS